MNGVVIIDKPAGFTSHDVVARVRRILHERRVGHTGTLDPFATGVLVVLVGRATKLAQFLSGAEKEYEAIIRFGYATNTGDATGTLRQETFRLLDEKDFALLSEKRIEAALDSLRGEQMQVPPMYSAKKVAGKKLYELARQGVEIERVAVPVFVREFEAIKHDGGALLHLNEDETIDLRARVVCSAGTYVRVLAEAVGEKLGIGAHLVSLRRTRAGAFNLTHAIGLDELQRLRETNTESAAFFSPNAALPELPALHLTAQEEQAVRNGVAVRIDEASLKKAGLTDGRYMRLRDASGELIAIGICDAAKMLLHPRVLIRVEE
ncbi:MAG: tRNA pseudouridine(55) synthase TruB [Pyrinomonadaceae bacterium]